MDMQEGVVRAAGSLSVFVLAWLGFRWTAISAVAVGVPAIAALVSWVSFYFKFKN